ncbi:YidH family protein [Rhodanobacter ginsengiterrae]|uniref:YidH family protein n=1 Tax=Rhodanobacter ginsengiterrae TaxID=2008451 RepID=UPI003CF169FF
MIPRFTDHAANERTYLAWVRTAITVMAFGFLLERFDILIAYASRASGGPLPHLHVRASEWLGLLLLLFGAAIVLLGSMRFQKNRKAIDDNASLPHGNTRLEQVLSWLLIAMAIFLVIYVAQQVIALS